MGRQVGTALFRRQIGERLRQRRIALQLTQEELAWEACLAQASISNYESGRTDLSIAALLAICRALRTRPGEIVPHFEAVGAESPAGHDAGVPGERTGTRPR